MKTIMKLFFLVLLFVLSLSINPTQATAQVVVDNDGDTYTVGAGDCNDNDVSVSPEGIDGTLAGPYAAHFVISTAQGLTKGGDVIAAERSDPTNALTHDPADLTSVFYSLGFGGEIVVGFHCPLTNGSGNDVRVYEKTFPSDTYPTELIEVYAWDEVNDVWMLLGTADNWPAEERSNVATDLDLGSLAYTTMIKIVDISNPDLHGDPADAFDLNGVYALQDCDTSCDGIDNNCDYDRDENCNDECAQPNILYNSGFEEVDGRIGLVNSSALNALTSWDIYDTLPDLT
ncbi:hypothetical protein KJ708_02120, partial [bacterium]|nr:hypothetical protein [bacterium]